MAISWQIGDVFFLTWSLNQRVTSIKINILIIIVFKNMT